MQIGSKSLRRAVVFGAGYVVGTRAGRERYSQIQSAARFVVGRVSDRYGRPGRTSDGNPPEAGRDGYDDITLGR